MKYDYRIHGITQSLLMTWVQCRQKAKWFLEGWSSPHPSMGLIYGTIVHGVLEKMYLEVLKGRLSKIPSTSRIKKYVGEVEHMWHKENPKVSKISLEFLELSLLIAESTLPTYFRYWFKEDFRKLKWLRVEQTFKIPYTTEDGRKTFLRGKKDGVIGKSLRLFETKTKSMINMSEMIDTLWFEFQVNFYLHALWKIYKSFPSGVLYNIIRRTCLKRKVGESLPSFSQRISEDIKKRPDFYFIRLNIKVTKPEILKFKDELEDLIVDFMDWCDGKGKHYKNTSHCSNKYGKCVYLGLCSYQNYAAYEKRKVMFRELGYR